MLSEKEINNLQELEYVIFCIENIAEKLKKKADQIYVELTEKSNILNDYIVFNAPKVHIRPRMH